MSEDPQEPGQGRDSTRRQVLIGRGGLVVGAAAGAAVGASVAGDDEGERARRVTATPVTPTSPTRPSPGPRTSATAPTPSGRSASDQELSTGEVVILSAAFEKDGEGPPGVGVATLSLYHGDTKVGEGLPRHAPPRGRPVGLTRSREGDASAPRGSRHQGG
jgi:hypothetical protein